MVKSLHTQLFRILRACAMAIAVVPGTLSAQQPAAHRLASNVNPQARQMLDRAIQVLGGPAFLNAKSLTTKGRVFFFQDGATVGMQPYESWAVYPDKRRFSYGKTKPVILINNGDKGWELDRYGLISQPDKQVQGWIIANRFSLENLLRLRINDPGILIQIGNVDFVDNVPTQGIQITEPGETSVRLDLHRQTFVPSRISYRVRNVKENAWDDYSDAYSDYRLIDGIDTPMHITHYLNEERIGEIFRNYAKYNEDYPANYFTAE